MLRSVSLLLAAALSVGAAGCAPRIMSVPAARTSSLNLDGPAPDVVVLGMSGRCGPPCRAPRDNRDVLSARGTLDAVADSIAAAGYRVQVAGYASHPGANFSSPYVQPQQRGFGGLWADVQRMRATWLRAPRPPRLVLLGHSQGGPWLHYLSRVTPDVPYALQIDLDSICVTWKGDFTDLIAENPLPAVLPSPLAACENMDTPVGRRNAKDIVWPNVARNLEVQSKRLPARPGEAGGVYLNYLFEVTPNIRPDSSTTGIERFVAWKEDHSAVSAPGSESLTWVTIRTNDLARTWKSEDLSSR
ncbi:hypothetical protein GCM10008955_07190 [Deinococcus malanensis]|uniref:Alpha/beta hydrolase n=2 Tax=Deinococcus malanensis TaxID=1706855 RepID=A0ABQ2EM29_9DEIO|nr:hypothetical protein [Deinococcus malanensis]GGK16342.1 hypothetical protein GCM10008955_07190 [Deinococcus malanensis]